jgi:hypothetical protein
MELKRITLAAAAAVFAVSGIGSILVLQGQPRSVDAIDLSDDPAIRRPEDNGPALELVDDDDSLGDGDDTNGDDGSAGGANTGDGDNTAGDDGTSGGNNTGDNSNTGGATTN